uniref:Uncharacterized protein n=1 Tax=Arundo donax TaxID=35708 RepID=A0A0A9DIQ9_ARUDO
MAILDSSMYLIGLEFLMLRGRKSTLCSIIRPCEYSSHLFLVCQIIFLFYS